MCVAVVCCSGRRTVRSTVVVIVVIVPRRSASSPLHAPLRQREVPSSHVPSPFRGLSLPLAVDAIVCGGRRPPRLLPPHSVVWRHLTGPFRPQSWWRSTTSPSAVDAAQTPSRIRYITLHLCCISVFGPACLWSIASFPLAGYPSRRLGVPQTSTVFRHSVFVALHWATC